MTFKMKTIKINEAQWKWAKLIIDMILGNSSKDRKLEIKKERKNIDGISSGCYDFEIVLKSKDGKTTYIPVVIEDPYIVDDQNE